MEHEGAFYLIVTSWDRGTVLHAGEAAEALPVFHNAVPLEVQKNAILEAAKRHFGNDAVTSAKVMIDSGSWDRVAAEDESVARAMHLIALQKDGRTVHYDVLIDSDEREVTGFRLAKIG